MQLGIIHHQADRTINKGLGNGYVEDRPNNDSKPTKKLGSQDDLEIQIVIYTLREQESYMVGIQPMEYLGLYKPSRGSRGGIYECHNSMDILFKIHI